MHALPIHAVETLPVYLHLTTHTFVFALEITTESIANIVSQSLNLSYDGIIHYSYYF